MTSLHNSAHLGLNQNHDIICEGWMLKKRRKKMQGFARRYFVLHRSGVLSYSFDPKHPSRDEIFLPNAAVSTAPGRKDIHIDSNNATFHVKCLSADDFNTWMFAFRKCIPSESRKSTMGRATPTQRVAHSQSNMAGAIVEAMGASIAELEQAIGTLEAEEASKRNPGSLKSKAEKDKYKEHTKDASMFSLFKKPGGHSESNSSHRGHPENTTFLHFQRIQEIMDALKSQQADLLRSLHAPPHTDNAPPAPTLLATTPEERGDFRSPSRFSTLAGRQSRRMSRMSVSTTASDAEWFDAGEEFTLDEPTPEEEKADVAAEDDDDDIHDSGSSDEECHPTPTRRPSRASRTPSQLSAKHVVRRTQLPSGPVGDEGSLFTILKKNVGKDLSTIAVPVSFNEPLSLLQRMAEEVEYHTLLDQCAKATDPVERICHVAAFAVSSYAHTRYRSGRKGFNPMLAETFEDVRMKFIAEKVSHNPVILAYHAEGEGWELYATSAGKTKFWGKSLEIIPLGATHLRISDAHYTWNKPSSFMRNLMMGTKYLEHVGKMTIESVHDKYSCVLEFKQSGYWGASNEVSGVVTDAHGKKLATLEGKWDEQIAQVLDSSHLKVLWRMTPMPKEALEYYGFTAFGITLNEITPDMNGCLPPTDSRLRPDIRALEEGDGDKAEAEKTRVEEAQRERRRASRERQPRWFRQDGEEWVYTGGYWETRSSSGWKEASVEPLW